MFVYCVFSFCLGCFWKPLVNKFKEFCGDSSEYRRFLNNGLEQRDVHFPMPKRKKATALVRNRPAKVAAGHCLFSRDNDTVPNRPVFLFELRLNLIGNTFHVLVRIVEPKNCFRKLFLILSKIIFFIKY